MTRRERLETIFSQFDRSADDFCKEIDGLFCEITSDYKGAKAPENLKRRTAKIYCRSFLVLFRYTAHGMMGSAHSILDCAVCFGKADGEIAVPLPFVVDFGNYDTVAPVCIPFISDEAGMKQAFQTVGHTVKQMEPTIADISCDPARKQAMERYYFEEFSAFMGKSGREEFAVEFFSQWILMRLSSSPYTMALKGNMEKAIRKMKKFKRKFRYEQRLLALWEDGKTMDRTGISAIVSNMEWVNNQGMEKVNGKELLACILAWFVLAVPVSAVYFLIYFVSVWIQSCGSIYITGVLLQSFACFFAGFVTAMAISYFARFWFYRRIFRKGHDKLQEHDQIFNGGGSDKVMKGVLTVVAVGSLVFIVLMSKYNLIFKENGFIDHTTFFSLRGTYYGYEEIETFKYVPDRVNGFGETLDFPSYALVLKNGKEIDLYDLDAIENYEQTLTALMQKHGVKIEGGR